MAEGTVTVYRHFTVPTSLYSRVVIKSSAKECVHNTCNHINCILTIQLLSTSNLKVTTTKRKTSYSLFACKFKFHYMFSFRLLK